MRPPIIAVPATRREQRQAQDRKDRVSTLFLGRRRFGGWAFRRRRSLASLSLGFVGRIREFKMIVDGTDAGSA
ncbi:hypothetical protein SJ05684_c29160 [Sinorhizobium sojae CCBAU 05684]|uniref:Uncharacterized protein n=1 Tax=Sinorhizobium sojae CCBAU 05684 TaxID=716928 RepID=A0A249PEV0_9HYPH|nr:hypothetical protein SJ05684_c29160 [Sinorhizobium sojae CCBAU 05684]